jgi:hypothetical protein
MAPAEIAAMRLELGRCRQQADGAFGRAMQLLDQFENAWREQQRRERLTVAERTSLEAE